MLNPNRSTDTTNNRACDILFCPLKDHFMTFQHLFTTVHGKISQYLSTLSQRRHSWEMCPPVTLSGRTRLNVIKWWLPFPHCNFAGIESLQFLLAWIPHRWCTWWTGFWTVHSTEKKNKCATLSWTLVKCATLQMCYFIMIISEDWGPITWRDVERRWSPV